MNPIFYFDFGSPNAYLAHCELADVAARSGVTFDYVPVLLGGLFKLTGNQPPMMAFAEIPAKLAYTHREIVRYADRRGVPFRMNPHFPVNTLALMRGATAAQAMGVLADYVEAMFRFMWVEPRKLDDPAMLTATIGDAGLDPAILERAQTPEIKQRLVDNTNAAAARGIFGIPSFAVGDEIFFGKDSLPEVEREIARVT